MGKAGEARSPRYYPAYDIKPKVKAAPAAPPKLRASLTPGTIVIILAGRFRGKRAIMLKAEEGLLVVTGPYAVNGVPLRRVNPAYVIATSTKIDVSGVTVPEVDSTRPVKKTKKPKKGDETEFFEDVTEETVTVSEEKKAAQAELDAQIMPLVEAVPLLKEYLGALFTLTKGMKPHEMKW